MRIGIDIGGSKIAAIAINSDGILLSKTQIPVSQNYSELLSSIFSILDSLETNLNMKSTSLGISVAGHLSLDGNISSAANLPWIVGKDLRSDLRQAFPNCKISNCSNFKAFANFLVGSKAESQELYLVYGMPKETGCISIAAKKKKVCRFSDTESRKLAPNGSNFVKSHCTVGLRLEDTKSKEK